MRANLNKYWLSGVSFLLHQYGVHGIGPVPLLEPWCTKEKVWRLGSMVMSSSYPSMVVTVGASYSSRRRVRGPLVVKHWCLNNPIITVWTLDSYLRYFRPQSPEWGEEHVQRWWNVLCSVFQASWVGVLHCQACLIESHVQLFTEQNYDQSES